MSELDEFKDLKVEHLSDLAEILKNHYNIVDSVIRQLLKKDGSVSETSGKVDDVVPQVNETLSAYDKYLLKHSQKTPEPSPMSTQVEEV
ncbi:Protein CBG23769, partial [Caenorhabditis briggsae]